MRFEYSEENKNIGFSRYYMTSGDGGFFALSLKIRTRFGTMSYLRRINQDRTIDWAHGVWGAKDNIINDSIYGLSKIALSHIERTIKLLVFV